MSTRYWFRPKRFGYGATPNTWQGWAFTLGTAAVVAGAVVVSIIAERRQWPNREVYLAICAVVEVVTLIGSIVVTRRKTDGEWRWRS